MKYIQWINNSDVIAGTTLRDTSMAENNDLALHTGSDKNAVLENRRALSKELGIPLSQWTFAQQTHSDHIHEVTMDTIGKGSIAYEDGIADCDALYTKQANAPIGVFHADCVPILLYDPFTHLIAAIHSGWQGTVKEITRKSVQRLMEKEGVLPAHLHAYIGPSISERSFEVGSDVIKRVQDMSFDTSSYITPIKQYEKALVDQQGLNEAMLLQLGVLPHHITVNKNDTFLPNKAFFSYRRDHACGRHLSFIMLKR